MTDDEHPTYNGRYEVQRRIARGGMADVFLAKDLLLARPVAVKVLFPEFASDPSFVARFRREAQAAANLNHPNIVGVYDWGQEGGTYYIVMEYIDGRSLSEILRTQGSPPPRTAAGIVADVAAALGFAHRNGVVHRDVKPGNIMITSGGHVKVADFGIARAMTASAEDNLTQTGSVMGTATYFSPEQAQGHDVDQRSDLYSLGIVMYEMVNGRPPFTAESPIAVAYKHVQETPPGLRTAHPDLPVGYEAICMRLLAKAPDDRYPDADALRADLRRFLEGQRVRAPSAAAAAGAAGAGVAGAAIGAGAAGAGTASGTAVAGAAPSGADGAVPPGEQTRSSRTGWFLLLLLLLLAVLGGLLFLFANTLGIGDDTRKEVPDVTGQPVTQAREVLEAEGFEVNPDPQFETSETVDRDHVISQDPPGGARAEEGATVTLVVSSGPPEGERAAVPPVEGLDVEEAERRLEAAGFTDIRITRRFDDDAPEDEVVSQSPAAGVEVEVDETITLFVSNGPPPTTAPPTTTAPPPPSTTEPPPSTTEPPPSTTEPPPSTTEPPPSTTEPPTSPSSTSTPTTPDQRPGG